MAKNVKTIEHLDKLIARWKTRLRTSINRIDKLEKQRKRLLLRPAPIPVAVPPVLMASVATPVPPPATLTPSTATVPGKPDADANLDIPEFLRRQKTPDLDMVAAEQIRLEQEAAKRQKARGRIDKMKAKKSGETKKMPLTGKAALAAIRD